MPLAAGMDDTSIKSAKCVEATRCNVTVKAKWDNGSKVELEMFDLDPNTIAELIPWLRERRINDKEQSDG